MSEDYGGLVTTVRAALAKATPGPWGHDLNGFIAVVESGGEWGRTVAMDPRYDKGHSLADMELIAHAPSWLASLCERVEALEKKQAECDTCEGTGVMSVLDHVLPPDEREVYVDEQCGECHGTGVGYLGKLEAKVEALEREREGNNERATLLLNAKQHWLDRAVTAEADVARLTRERDDFYADYRIRADIETKASLVRAERAEAALASARALLNEWVEAVLANYPKNWAFDPTNPRLMVENVKRGAALGEGGGS